MQASSRSGQTRKGHQVDKFFQQLPTPIFTSPDSNAALPMPVGRPITAEQVGPTSIPAPPDAPTPQSRGGSAQDGAPNPSELHLEPLSTLEFISFATEPYSRQNTLTGTMMGTNQTGYEPAEVLNDTLGNMLATTPYQFRQLLEHFSPRPNTGPGGTDSGEASQAPVVPQAVNASAAAASESTPSVWPSHAPQIVYVPQSPNAVAGGSNSDRIAGSDMVTQNQADAGPPEAKKKGKQTAPSKKTTPRIQKAPAKPTTQAKAGAGSKRKAKGKTGSETPQSLKLLPSPFPSAAGGVATTPTATSSPDATALLPLGPSSGNKAAPKRKRNDAKTPASETTKKKQKKDLTVKSSIMTTTVEADSVDRVGVGDDGENDLLTSPSVAKVLRGAKKQEAGKALEEEAGGGDTERVIQE